MCGAGTCCRRSRYGQSKVRSGAHRDGKRSRGLVRIGHVGERREVPIEERARGLTGDRPTVAGEVGLVAVAGVDGEARETLIALTAQLGQARGAMPVGDAAALTAAVNRLLDDPVERRRMARAAGAVAQRNRGVVSTVMATLEPLITPILA